MQAYETPVKCSKRGERGRHIARRFRGLGELKLSQQRVEVRVQKRARRQKPGPGLCLVFGAREHDLPPLETRHRQAALVAERALVSDTFGEELPIIDATEQRYTDARAARQDRLRAAALEAGRHLVKTARRRPLTAE